MVAPLYIVEHIVRMQRFGSNTMMYIQLRLLPSVLLLLLFVGDVVLSVSEDRIHSATSETTTCSLYLAESTIPNAGMGVFTTVPLEKGDKVASDIGIPIIDLEWHNGGGNDSAGKDFHWMINHYQWEAYTYAAASQYEAGVDTAMLSPGMGTLCNSHLGLDNLGSNWATYDISGLERTDPGMGAFSGYHNRESFTTRDIRAGAELFISYGENWFRSREKKFGPVPHQKNYIFAERFLVRWHRIANKLTAATSSVNSSGDDEVNKDLWHMIRSWPWKSRSLAALPMSLEGVSIAQEIGLKGAELEGSVRSHEWLREHGKCMDNIEIKQSPKPQVGRGAFAKRFIQKGDVIAPAPLIHIPYKDTLSMYSPDTGNTPSSDNNRTTDIIGEQLLLNYCFGHKQSSILLCPYSNGVPYINHNHQSPNARIVWPERPLVHNSAWLDQTVEYIDENLNSVAFEFDIVATRDLQPGEEVFIDYGQEWEEAWNEHVSTWTPETGHVDSSRFNCIDDKSCMSTIPIRTEDEQLDEPYPENLSIFCFFNETDERVDETSFDWDSELDDWKRIGLMNKYNCTILERQLNDRDKYTYTVELSLPFDEDDSEDDEEDDDEDSALVVLNKVPQWSIVFVNNPYTGPMHRRGAFRHHMMIPGDMFPESWKNLM